MSKRIMDSEILVIGALNSRLLHLQCQLNKGKSNSQIFTQVVAIPSEPSEPHHSQRDSDSDTVFTTAIASTPSFIDLENMRPSFLPNPHIPIMNDDIAAAAAMHVPNADVRPPSGEKN